MTLGVRAYAQAAESRTFHFRTHGGDREVDLLHELLGAIAVTTGRHPYRRRDGVGVVPAVLLEP